MCLIAIKFYDNDTIYPLHMSTKLQLNRMKKSFTAFSVNILIRAEEIEIVML